MLQPGAAIGILGGGQLGRMLALAAAPLGLRTHVFTPDRGSPAAEIASAVSEAAYDDEAALAAFAQAVDVVTYEFENVPAGTAAFLMARVPVHPGPRALEVAQDRLNEKTFAQSLGLATAPFAPVDDADAAASAFAALGGGPAILKTRRLGYDGKGQTRVHDADGARAAFAALGGVPCILEGFVPFVREISVVVARAADGTLAPFDPIENVHRDGILASSRVPARIAPETAGAALEAAGRMAGALGYVGVLAVEFFVGEDGSLKVNEIAPRVHNSGHLTIEACETSQFEQHIRAVAGWPLGAPRRLFDAGMDNLIGPAAGDWARLAREPGAHLHLYGKGEPRPGRKMGHVTRRFGRA